MGWEFCGMCYSLSIGHQIIHDIALEEINNASVSEFIIFTDSLSCLQALLYTKLEHPLIGMAIWKCVFLNIANKDNSIKGNDKADSAAKATLDLSHAQVGVPYTDFKHLINQYIFSTWQDDWNGAVMNKLHSVKPVLGDWQSSYRRCRKDEVVLCRAHIGQTYLTHSYILKNMYSDGSSHFGGVQSSRSDKKWYIW